MKEIILIRHGSIEPEYDNCYIGATDVPLSAQGFREAEALGKYLSSLDCDHIFASPQLRARQTLETALPAEKLKKVRYDNRLREIDFGDWEGKTFAEINAEYPAEVHDWTMPSNGFCFPNGSNPEEFHNGIDNFKRALLESSGSRIMVFAHGGVILAFICNVLGINRDRMLAFKVDRGSVTVLDLFENGCGILKGINIKPVLSC
ncbi:MAG: histidine phosphatase family protein [Victivallaceae bacterium]|nr:histidine phosphatase family protein [Victivallaceae bacterium]